jgi:DNA polymerase III delta prime subunit
MEPIHSRCAVIDFRIQNGKEPRSASFFKRVEWILQQENITYDKEVVATLITKYFPDNRRILNELQRYSSAGTIEQRYSHNRILDVSINDLIKTIKDKDFTTMRKWVTQNLDNDPATLYRKIYDNLYEYLKPNSIPQAVLILAKYQYQSAFALTKRLIL